MKSAIAATSARKGYRPSRWLKIFACSAALACGLWPSAAAAAPTNDPKTLTNEERDKVKALADEGMRLYDAKDYTTALSKFEAAEEVILIPTITLQRARCLERLGRWVEARDAYTLAAEMELLPNAAPPLVSAKREAGIELNALDPKVPRVTVSLKNGDGEIFVDGRSRGRITTEPLLIDPGKHVIEVRAADLRVANKTVDLASGQSLTVELALETPAGAGPTTLQILGWLGVGLGSASLIVTVATGVPAILLSDDLEAQCPNSQCPPSLSADVDRYDGMRWSAGVFLFAGLAFAGAGMAALFIDTKPATTGAPAITPILGPGFAGLSMRFL